MVFDFPQVLLLWTAFFFVVVGLPALFAPIKFRKVLDKLMKNEDMMRTRGVITLLFGLAYLTVYQAIDASWGLMFSLIGYMSLIKGLRLIWIPGYAQKKYTSVYNTTTKVMMIGIAVLAVAVFFVRAASVKF